MGDFNNVLKAQDRTIGNLVSMNKYKDRVDMMEQTGIHDKDSIGDHFTWTNNQINWMIYLRIDRV